MKVTDGAEPMELESALSHGDSEVSTHLDCYVALAQRLHHNVKNDKQLRDGSLTKQNKNAYPSYPLQVKREEVYTLSRCLADIKGKTKEEWGWSFLRFFCLIFL